MMSGMGSLEEVMRAGQEAAAAKAADQNQATAAEAANPDSEGQEKRA
jgi:ribosomal protein L12E/L44/L45/RPP1/RPP2